VKTLRGASLVETVVALFVLLSAFTFVAALYNQSLSHHRNVERKEEATRFLSNTLEEVRAWAGQPANYLLPTWAPFSSVTDPRFPEFEVRVEVASANLSGSCDSLEQAKDPADRVLLTGSARLVTATVLDRGREIQSVSTLIIEPDRAAQTVEVFPVPATPATLGREAEAVFEARLLDVDGEVIPDVSFNWAVVPSTGNASISSVNSGLGQGTLRNTNSYYAGPVYYTGGKCLVEASTSYRGVQYIGLSDEVQLAP
jgi:type II secretory pathway pseudopilin PulG